MSFTPQDVDEAAATIAAFRANAPAALIQSADRLAKDLTAMLPGAEAMPGGLGVVLLAVTSCVVLQDYTGDGRLADVLQYTPGPDTGQAPLKDMLPLALALAGQQLYQEEKTQ
jgi:hypothetical protein